MDLIKFRVCLETEFFSKMQNLKKINNIPGFNSARTQCLINIAVGCLRDTNEAYFEVGCFNGSSLHAASFNNDIVPKYACDITCTSTLTETMDGIPRLKFIKDDFFKVNLDTFLSHPIGIFYWDGRHEYEDLINALTRIEPYLSDKAIIFVDDLEYNRVYNSWRDFFKRPENIDRWTIVHEFWTPDKFIAIPKGHPDSWWDGFAIAEFERIPDRPSQMIEWFSMQIYKGKVPYKARKGTLYPSEFKNIHGKGEIKDGDL